MLNINKLFWRRVTIEEICDNYPVEYALLKKQNLQSVIIFPIRFNKLVGFVKINNPR